MPSVRTSIPVTSTTDPRTSLDARLVAAWAIKIVLGLIVIALLIVLSAALAGPIHSVLYDADDPPHERLDDFLKVFRRLMVIFLIGAALAYFRPWRQMKAGNHDYGLRGPRARYRPGLIGFATVVAVIAAILAWHFQEGWLKWEDPLDWGKVAKRFGRVLIAPALLVALFEEFLFRGWLQTSAEARMRPFRAALLVSFGFGFIHAFRPSSSTVDVALDTAGALEAFQAWLAYAVDPAGFGPAFLGLFLFGLMLTAAYKRTGTLWTPIGIHMAGAWIIYSYGSITDRHPGRTWAGGKLLYDGPVGWGILLIATLLLWPRARSPAPGSRVQDSGTP